MTIAEAVKKLAKQDRFESLLGKVKDINLEKLSCTVTPIDDLPDILDVRLNAVENPSKGTIPVPVEGSVVIVGQTANEQPHILLFSEIDTYQLIAETSITLNDGSYGGLIKIEELVDKLNAIEDKINQLIIHYKAHNHLHPQGPTTAFVSPFTGNNLSNTQVEDLENGKILHGE